MRRVIIAGIVLLVGAFALSRFLADPAPDQVLRRLNGNGTIVRRSCGLGEAHVDAALWRQMSAANQQRAASALASWCAEQGGVNTLTLIDANTHVPVAKWNGTALEAQR